MWCGVVIHDGSISKLLFAKPHLKSHKGELHLLLPEEGLEPVQGLLQHLHHLEAELCLVLAHNPLSSQAGVSEIKILRKVQNQREDVHSTGA